MDQIVAFVMAGGEGVRLRPHTLELPKPALPFHGESRIVDFVLSNLVNSGVRRIFVLAQYKPQPLLDHLARRWSAAALDDDILVEPVLPAPGATFLGTADAVRQGLHRLAGCPADLIGVFAADHVYRIDVRQMAAFHARCGADVTVAAVPVPIGQASAFGVIGVDHRARITGFDEKPACPQPIPGDPRRAFVSMGNYLFRPGVLREALDAGGDGEGHDFGRHLLPRLVQTRRVHAYDFRRNVVPGLTAYEEPGYWRDVGTVEAYAQAQRDACGPRPLIALDNPAWPIGRAGLPSRSCLKAA